MKINELREIGFKLGREGLSKAAIELIEKFDGSYKGAIELCGQLSVIAKACSFDTYWHEQAKRGELKAEGFLYERAQEGEEK